MKRTFFLNVSVLLSLILAIPGYASGLQETELQAGQEKQIKLSAFYNVEWRELIEYYADQAGLSLQIVHTPPTGTFDYASDRSMSLSEALDFLNQMLIQNDRVLIRNEDLLLLYDVTIGIPDDMIQTVSSDQLDQRGKYEVLNCNFDITGLQAEELRNQLEPYISDHYRRKLAVIPAANVMIVQEIGYKLRFIRDQILGPALKSRGRNDWDVKQIELKHVTPEDVLVHASSAMGIRKDTLSTEDRSLTLSISPFGDQILVTGQPEQINQFLRIVEAVDIPMSGDDSTPREIPYFQRYAVVGDAEKMYKVLLTMLAGATDVRMEYDIDTNQIFLLGRTPDHEKALEVINKMEGSSDELAVISIVNTDVDAVIDTVETLFRQNSTTTDPVEGPVLTAESNNRLIVRGKPAEVAMVKKIVSEIDVAYSPTGPSLPTRFITLDGSEMNRSMNVLEYMLPQLGLPNRIEVVQPGDRSLFMNHKNKRFEVIGEGSDDDTSRPADLPTDDNRDPVDPGSGDQSSRSLRPIGLGPMIATLFAPGPAMGSMVSSYQEPVRNGTAESSQEQESSADPLIDDEKQPFQSVPGAPITIRITPYGIGLSSDDLEALDQIEQLIRQELGMSSGGERTVFFYLKYIDANEAKQLLEQYLGISSGGGGGAGGLGSLMSGLVGNAIGGGAGDMMSGLLGGGGSGTSASDGVFITEGVVTIVANVKNYSLAVSASPIDMELVTDLIDFIDQPGALHAPNPLGETRVIPVVFQDVVEVEAMIKQSLGAIISSNEPNANNGGGGGGGNEAAMLQALLGRGGRGNGGDNQEDLEAPKATISIDKKNSAIVVTGPQFAYDIIYGFIKSIDVPRMGPPNDVQVISPGNISSEKLVEIIGLQFPDMIEVIPYEGGTSETATPGTATPGQSEGAPAGANPAANLQALQQIMRAQQQRAQGQRGDRQGGRGGDRPGPGGGGGDGPPRGGG